MLQYLFVISLWSFMYYIQPVSCFDMKDINFFVYACAIIIDVFAHAIKAYRTLRAEYHLITGRPLSDCFLYVWPLMQSFKKISIWVSMGLLLTISPISCMHSPLLACAFLFTSLAIQKASKRVRKWWVHSNYDSVPIDSHDEELEFSIDTVKP